MPHEIHQFAEGSLSRFGVGIEQKKKITSPLLKSQIIRPAESKILAGLQQRYLRESFPNDLGTGVR